MTEHEPKIEIQPLTDEESQLATGIAERTGRWPFTGSSVVRYHYRDPDGHEQSREVEFGFGMKCRQRIDALRTALIYARRDHSGEKLG